MLYYSTAVSRQIQPSPPFVVAKYSSTLGKRNGATDVTDVARRMSSNRSTETEASSVIRVKRENGSHGIERRPFPSELSIRPALDLVPCLITIAYRDLLPSKRVGRVLSLRLTRTVASNYSHRNRELSNVKSKRVSFPNLKSYLPQRVFTVK